MGMKGVRISDMQKFGLDLVMGPCEHQGREEGITTTYLFRKVYVLK